MKSSVIRAWLALAVGGASWASFAAQGGESTNATITQTTPVQAVATTQVQEQGGNPTGTPAVTSNQSAAVRLPYGVEDVLKLSRAKISEDIVLNYIQNSGTIYNLGPQDIVYLRNEGVSDNTIKAMLDQRKRVEGAAAAAQMAQAATPAAVAPSYGDNGVVTTAPAAPESTPASSVYVIPYPPAEAAYYGYYRPYGYYDPVPPYYYYGGGPIVSLGFGFGGHFGGPGHGPGFGPGRGFGGGPVPGHGGGPGPGRGGPGRGGPGFGGHSFGGHH